MLPRKHWVYLAVLGAPWAAVLAEAILGKARGSILDLGDSRDFVVGLVLFSYGLQAMCCTLLVAALNWNRRRPGSETVVYWLSGVPSVVGLFAETFAACSPR